MTIRPGTHDGVANVVAGVAMLTGNAQIVDELDADDLVFSYRLHGELYGREPKLIFRVF